MNRLGVRGQHVTFRKQSPRDYDDRRDDACDDRLSFPPRSCQRQCYPGRRRAGRITAQALQVRAEIGGVLVAHVAVFLQRFRDDLVQARRKIGVQAQMPRADYFPESNGKSRRSCFPKMPAGSWPFRRARRRRRIGRCARRDPSRATCSGDIYAIVPTAVPGLVRFSSCRHIVGTAESAARRCQFPVLPGRNRESWRRPVPVRCKREPKSKNLQA